MISFNWVFCYFFEHLGREFKYELNILLRGVLSRTVLLKSLTTNGMCQTFIDLV